MFLPEPLLPKNNRKKQPATVSTEMTPRSAPVDHALTMHAAYWRRHTAPLGLPTALDVGKEEELEDFGCRAVHTGVWADIGFWALSPR